MSHALNSLTIPGARTGTFGKGAGRLAPSPTGALHLGNAFAFLSAWLSARSKNLRLVLRIEDIDPERSRPEYAAAIMEDLRWLGLGWDEGPDLGGPHAPYEQSRRLENYAAALKALQAAALTYPCYCTRKELRSLASAPHPGDEGAPYPGLCRHLAPEERQRLEAAGRRSCVRLNVQAAQKWLQEAAPRSRQWLARTPQVGRPGPAVRFAGSAKSWKLALPVCFNDAALGPQSISLERCGGDFALRRPDGVVAYQLAVALDDADMGICEVVRGDDLLLSSPRQILLLRLLGRPEPRYAHLPLVHDASGQRLAKRHKAFTLSALRAAGIRPEAICGWLAHLAGWTARLEAAHPATLIAAFNFACLRGRSLTVPENIVDILLRL